MEIANNHHSKKNRLGTPYCKVAALRNNVTADAICQERGLSFEVVLQCLTCSGGEDSSAVLNEESILQSLLLGFQHCLSLVLH